ncbi:MAG: 1-acyl-sn-glycerol-3-phosphate acyltransferase [Gammaproteobacteria bacterium]|nr:1-acyl-sn-glycerol-3-phosphate acyltransferase [Gammaproteobacteria bacterium]
MSLLRIILRVIFLSLVMLIGVIMAALFLRQTMSPAGFSAQITRLWHRQVCRAFNIEVTVYGQLPQQAMLLVANHISWFDITAIGSVISARYLSKYEVVGWPVIGWLAKKAGTLFIKRGTRQSAMHSMEKMTKSLQQGDHVVLFPEGKTSDGQAIKKFHARLFQSAVDSQVMIQPILICYPHQQGVHPKAPFINDITIYQSALGMLGESHMKVELHFLHALPTANKSRDQLAKECEELLRNHINNTGKHS